LESLEGLLKRLEQGVARLEEENLSLKAQNKMEEDGKSSGSPIEELEKQKLILLAQVEKLEAQLEKVKEAAILDKQAAKMAQNQLWKVRFNFDLLALTAFPMNIPSKYELFALRVLNFSVLGFKL
jgi:flagellar biosynthesis/type III secretory pathway chaperone